MTRLGAENQLCGNGQEALDIVCKALSELLNEGAEFPYDLILMDCQVIKLLKVSLFSIQFINAIHISLNE